MTHVCPLHALRAELRAANGREFFHLDPALRRAGSYARFLRRIA